ncbi:transmembrane protein 94-like [Branchiostoma lanceolatum]|uniref:transmembrane protein 94-like n=1 Tax=Branchiostoma lanceolatum TaxID=7740 RepID=UPI0034559B0F
MEMTNGCQVGLSTSEGLDILHTDISRLLREVDGNNTTGKTGWAPHWPFHHRNVRSTLPWTTVAIWVLQGAALFVAYGMVAQDMGRRDSLVVEAFVVLLVAMVMLFSVLQERQSCCGDLCCSAGCHGYAVFCSTGETVLLWRPLLFCWLPWLCCFLFCRRDSLVVEAFVVLLVAMVSCYLTGWDGKLHQEEMINKVKVALKKLEGCIESCSDLGWQENLYPDLYMPYCPAITAAWTYRDGQLVNLPAALLVRGDVIALRPGQTTPVRCRQLEGDGSLELQPGDTYSPSVPDSQDPPSSPRGVAPLRPCRFLVTQTTFTNNISLCLENCHRRPVSVQDRERHDVHRLVEWRLLPLTLVLVLLVNLLRFFLLRDDVGHWAEMLLALPVYAILPLLPPLFPWLWLGLNTYGTARVLALMQAGKLQQEYWSFEHIDVFEEEEEERFLLTQVTGTPPSYTPSSHPHHSLTTSSPHLFSRLIKIKVILSQFSSNELQINSQATLLLVVTENTCRCCPIIYKLYKGNFPHSFSLPVQWRTVRVLMWAVLTGRTESLPRTANILHTLGSVTALCCVDKRGVLSCPNASPEKVFFLTSLEDDGTRAEDDGMESEVSSETDPKSNDLADNKVNESRENLKIDLETQDVLFKASTELLQRDKNVEDKETHISSKKQTSNTPEKSQSQENVQRERAVDEKAVLQESFSEEEFFECHAEVLDITTDPHSSSGLRFDDTRWERHLNSLKPLGLNIMLNICNPLAVERSAGFMDHLNCVSKDMGGRAILRYRRCLCQLVQQIGFSDKVLELFKLKTQVAAYRGLGAGLGQDQLARRSSFLRNKLPLPNMVSVVTKDYTTGMLQLLTHGTADIVLDSCTDFWDGIDLCPLTDKDRKKILDFYHRMSLSAYCSAFAYRPMEKDEVVPIPLGEQKPIRAQVEKFCLGPVSRHLGEVFYELPVRETDEPRGADTPVSDTSLSSTHSQLYSASAHIFLLLICRPEDLLPPVQTLEDSNLSLASRGKGRTIRREQDWFSAQSRQVFIGMVSAQYQAKMDVVHMIEDLDTACIRFVHFSAEDELRSRIFSEKMGLEAGWNCHISLLSSPEDRSRHSSGPDGDRSRHSSGETDVPARRSKIHLLGSHAEERVPILEPSQVTFRDEVSEHLLPESPEHDVLDVARDPGRHLDLPGQDTRFSGNQSSAEVSRQCSQESQNYRYGGELGLQDSVLIRDDRHDDIISMETDVTSHHSDVFDMTNRAKLPRGIDNIRPHLENVDNVPLLVPLFTDATPQATKEMLKIMQEYGEVVCCVGSSTNIQNTGVFLQADVSVAVEPGYPQLCMRHGAPAVSQSQEKGSSPCALSCVLNTLPCSAVFNKEHNYTSVLLQMIQEARHLVLCIKNCLLFLLGCQLSISLVQLLSAVVLLPPPLSGGHVLWLSCLVVPALSASLVAKEVDKTVMSLAPGKNQNHLPVESLLQFGLHYAGRFIPSLGVCLLCFAFVLHAVCSKVSPAEVCHPVFGNRNLTLSWNDYEGESSTGLVLAQECCCFLLVMYFGVTSMSYVHRSHPLWRRLPFTNRVWLVCVLVILILQVVYFAVAMAISSANHTVQFSLGDVPLSAWLLGLLWVVVLVVCNELVKLHETRLSVRYQKRAKLQFGTKLGMNSPF